MWMKDWLRWLRITLSFSLVVVLAALIGYQVDVALPNTPTLSNTLTLNTQPPPSAVGFYDVLGNVVRPDEAERFLQTPDGQEKLSPENGAVAITDDLIDLGRQQFYEETFGNEYFLTDVLGVLDGPVNVATVTKAIVQLKGKPTTNLQIPMDRDVTIGGQFFAAGSLLNTGLDVPAKSLLPLGMRPRISKGQIHVGITCAMCHATLDPASGRVLEGAPNADLDAGLLLAMASNSAAMFRHTSVNPTLLPPGEQTYQLADGHEARLPHVTALEDAVDADFLSWIPGSFDSTPTLVNNPSQTPSSYTFEAYPYGWSGHSAIGWFHGLTTLNSNVHATNSDASTMADSSQSTLGIDKETYLGILLQNAANPTLRLPEAAQPSQFFDQVDPTPGEPAINQVIRMPGYPKGTPFMLDGLMANSPGFAVGEQLNSMSAWQNTLAPPPYPNDPQRDAIQQGAKIFNQAGCAECHSGRYFTNHRVIAQPDIGTQPSRAPTLASVGRALIEPRTYSNQVQVPLPDDPSILPVPTDITPIADQQLAFALSNPKGGYKVPSLIGLAVTAPYLHDGGVAAGSEAFELDPSENRLTITTPDRLGLPGTLLQAVLPDPSASLRVLLDRELRAATVAINRAQPDLQRANVDGSGHEYWVDPQAGFTIADQTALIEFLLSLDDNPIVLPSEQLSYSATHPR